MIDRALKNFSFIPIFDLFRWKEKFVFYINCLELSSREEEIMDVLGGLHDQQQKKESQFKRTNMKPWMEDVKSLPSIGKKRLSYEKNRVCNQPAENHRGQNLNRLPSGTPERPSKLL